MSPKNPETLFVPGANPLQGITLRRLALLGGRYSLTHHSAATLARFLPATGVTVTGRKASDHPGLWYDINLRALEAVAALKAECPNLVAPPALSRALPPEKLEAFVLQQTAMEIFAVLLDLRLAGDATALVPDSPLHRWLVDRARAEGRLGEISFYAPASGLWELGKYYVQLLRELVRRGLRWTRKRPRYALARQAFDGFDRAVLRDDLLVDGTAFTAKDILFLLDENDPSRADAARECASRGYACVDERGLPVNVRGRAAELFGYYVLGPALDWRACRKTAPHLARAACELRREGLSTETVLSNFDVGTFVSCRDWGDLPQTMIANAYGAKNTLIQWSDTACYKTVLHSFVAPDFYFFWGPLFREHHQGFSRIGRAVDVGCIFDDSVREFKGRADALRASYGLAARPTVVFFDSSFNDCCEFDEAFFLSYLELILAFCVRRPDIQVLLKPKRSFHYDRAVSESGIPRFLAAWDRLSALPNFKYLLGFERTPEAAMSLADAVVSMAMISPSTIALLGGIEALYFDTTGNVHHPIAKDFTRKVVFAEPAGLLDKLDMILAGKASVFDDLPPTLLTRLDSGAGAVPRIRAILAEALGLTAAPTTPIMFKD